MFCEKCGSQIGDGAAFCGKCGNRVAIQKSSDVTEVEVPVANATKPVGSGLPAVNDVAQKSCIPSSEVVGNGVQTNPTVQTSQPVNAAVMANAETVAGNEVTRNDDVDGNPFMRANNWLTKTWGGRLWGVICAAVLVVIHFATGWTPGPAMSLMTLGLIAFGTKWLGDGQAVREGSFMGRLKAVMQRPDMIGKRIAIAVVCVALGVMSLTQKPARIDVGIGALAVGALFVPWRGGRKKSSSVSDATTQEAVAQADSHGSEGNSVRRVSQMESDVDSSGDEISAVASAPSVSVAHGSKTGPVNVIPIVIAAAVVIALASGALFAYKSGIFGAKEKTVFKAVKYSNQKKVGYDSLDNALKEALIEIATGYTCNNNNVESSGFDCTKNAITGLLKSNTDIYSADLNEDGSEEYLAGYNDGVTDPDGEGMLFVIEKQKDGKYKQIGEIWGTLLESGPEGKNGYANLVVAKYNAGATGKFCKGMCDHVTYEYSKTKGGYAEKKTAGTTTEQSEAPEPTEEQVTSQDENEQQTQNSSSIEGVKGGILSELDDSITIAQALENSRRTGRFRWDEMKDDQGRQYVQFSNIFSRKPENCKDFDECGEYIRFVYSADGVSFKVAGSGRLGMSGDRVCASKSADAETNPYDNSIATRGAPIEYYYKNNEFIDGGTNVAKSYDCDNKGEFTPPAF